METPPPLINVPIDPTPPLLILRPLILAPAASSSIKEKEDVVKSITVPELNRIRDYRHRRTSSLGESRRRDSWGLERGSGLGIEMGGSNMNSDSDLSASPPPNASPAQAYADSFRSQLSESSSITSNESPTQPKSHVRQFGSISMEFLNRSGGFEKDKRRASKQEREEEDLTRFAYTVPIQSENFPTPETKINLSSTSPGSLFSSTNSRYESAVEDRRASDDSIASSTNFWSSDRRESDATTVTRRASSTLKPLEYYSSLPPSPQKTPFELELAPAPEAEEIILEPTETNFKIRKLIFPGLPRHGDMLYQRATKSVNFDCDIYELNQINSPGATLVNSPSPPLPSSPSPKTSRRPSLPRWPSKTNQTVPISLFSFDELASIPVKKSLGPPLTQSISLPTKSVKRSSSLNRWKGFFKKHNSSSSSTSSLNLKPTSSSLSLKPTMAIMEPREARKGMDLGNRNYSSISKSRDESLNLLFEKHQAEEQVTLSDIVRRASARGEAKAVCTS